MWLLQPKYIDTLWSEAIGVIAVCAAIGLSVIGWFWLQRIVDIEV
jgi:Flp pilus assembly protein TadB